MTVVNTANSEKREGVRERLHDVFVAGQGCWHVHPATLEPLPEGEWSCNDFQARLAAHGLTITEVGDDAERQRRLGAAVERHRKVVTDGLFAYVVAALPKDVRHGFLPEHRQALDERSAAKDAIAAALGGSEKRPVLCDDHHPSSMLGFCPRCGQE